MAFSDLPASPDLPSREAPPDPTFLNDGEAAAMLKELNDLKAALDEHAIVAITDQRGKIIYVNEKFCAISKYSREELLGQDHRIINSGYHPKAFIRSLWQTVAHGHVWKGEIKNRAKDGTFYWVDTTIVPYLDERGKPYQYIAIRADITERKRIEEQMSQTINELADLKAALDEHAIVALTDQRGKIIYVNDKFCAISKYSRDELVGQDHRIINSGYHPKAFIRSLWQTISQGRVWKGEMKNRAKDGTFYWVDTTIVPYLNDHGKPYQYIAIRADITERKRIEESLHAASQAKSDFLANMSHELRTPLNSLLLLSDQLAANREGNLSVRQIEFLETIQSSGQDLLRIINDILDLSKIEAGSMNIDLSELPVGIFVEKLRRGFAPVAERRGLTYEVAVGTGMPAMLETDEQRLDQLLKNLLSNAFKFTDQGSVKLRVDVANQGWRKGHEALDRAASVIAFSVADTGIGMPAEQHEAIFEAFRQADGGTSRKYGGTGLGLAICREIAQLLSGELRVQSAPGRGSTFTLYLPQNTPLRPPYELPQLRSASVPTPSVAPPFGSHVARAGETRRHLTGRSVLMVDDDVRNLFALSALLEEQEMTVFQAESGREAIAILLENPEIDVVLMDIMMPDMDGYETMRTIRQTGRFPHIPMLALTAKAMAGDREKCIEAGANDYLTKPINTKLLLDRLRTLLPQQDRVRPTPPAGSATATTARTAARLLLVEDHDDTRRTLGHLLEQRGYVVRTARDVTSALALAHESEIDLLISDLGLPDGTGLDLLRDLSVIQPTAAIAVSGYGTEDDIARIQAAGFARHFTKPIDFEQLDAAIQSLAPSGR